MALVHFHSSPSSTPLLVLPLLLFFLLLHLAQLAQSSNSTAPVVSAVIVFGDSIVDPGNNNVLLTPLKSNFPPYGRDFAGHVPTGRFSNGKISTDFLASKLGVKELLPAYLGTNLAAEDLLTGVSFASAGTGYDPLTARAASVIPVLRQVDMFREYKERLAGVLGGNGAVLKHFSDSLFILCAGSNDLVEYYANPIRQLAGGSSSYTDFLVQTASTALQELVGLGASKVAIIGIPPIGCMPSQRFLAGGLSRDCVADLNMMAQTYNSKLEVEIHSLKAKLKGARLFYIDAYSILFDLIQNPKGYGFEESSLGCCGSGTVEVAGLCNDLSTTCEDASRYVFWDSIHPTERACEVLVQQLIQRYIHLIQG